MTKLYKYYLYRVYSFMEKRNTIPIVDTIVASIIVHWIQSFSILLIINDFIYDVDFPESNRLVLGLIIISLSYIYYLLYFKGDKIKIYKKMFMNESLKERIRNGYILSAYIIISISFLFVYVLAMQSLKSSN